MAEVKLYNGDCLSVMENLIENGVKVDAIITDPPYGTTACKWDSIIPFPDMWERLNKLIKDNGAIVLFGSEPFSSALRMSNLKQYKYDWIWNKKNGNGFMDCNCRPLKIHEVVSVFSKGGASNGSPHKMKYFPQGLISINKKIHRISNGSVLNDVKQKDYIQKFSNYPNSILQFSKDNSQIHPTQKPVPLLEYLIRTYTKENEIVLDFTMGSGSTGVACVNTNRQFIGIELNESFFKVAEERINKAEQEQKEWLFDDR